MTATTQEPQGHQGDGRPRRFSIASFVLSIFVGLSAYVLFTFLWDSYIDSKPFVLDATLKSAAMFMLVMTGGIAWQCHRARSREARTVTRQDSTGSRLP